MSISVLGAGAFGTALAISLARETSVTLWARDAGTIQVRRENTKRLPGCPFPDQLNVTDRLDFALKNDVLLLAIPMQSLAHFIEENSSALPGKQLVACCKGIDLARGLGPVQILKSVLPDTPAALLTGPSFAIDIAKGLPTALTLACADDAMGAALQKRLTTANLRLYRTTDTIGAELGGALKNVIAIACGAAIGAGLGESARAALMTRGFAEMQRLATLKGADPYTLAGLSGFGDLTLTCTSATSRNYRLGLALGEGSPFDPSITVEGAATAQAVAALAKRDSLDMPITNTVAALVSGGLDVNQAIAQLLSRPLKEE
jgi:glycerol-3-phosphate dehydrogenase (NAD(P)+)